MGFSAVNTGNNLVYIVTSALLSYMLVSGIFGRKNIQDIEVEAESPDDIFALTDFPLGVRVRNPRRFMPAFLLTVSVGDSEVFFPFIAPRALEIRHVVRRFEDRGLHAMGNVTISSTFPFNLFTRSRNLRAERKIVVYPRPVKCSGHEVAGARNRQRGDRTSDRIGYDSDLVSIRDYAVGDPPRYIHWKATAKTGRLKTKELSSPERRHVMIDVDRMDKRNLERTLGCVVHLVLGLLKQGAPVGLVAGGKTFKPDLSPAHKKRMLTALALYDRD